jgi:hypothetical protein
MGVYLTGVVSRPRFGCYSPIRTDSTEVAEGFSWAGPRRQGGSSAHINVLFSSGR